MTGLRAAMLRGCVDELEKLAIGGSMFSRMAKGVRKARQFADDVGTAVDETVGAQGKQMDERINAAIERAVVPIGTAKVPVLKPLLAERRPLAAGEITPAMRRMADAEGLDPSDIVVAQSPTPMMLRIPQAQPHFQPLGRKIQTSDWETRPMINRLAGRKLVREGPSEAITMHEMGHASGRFAKEHPLANQVLTALERGAVPAKARQMAEKGTGKGSLRAAQALQGASAASVLAEEGRASYKALSNIGREYGIDSPQFRDALVDLVPAQTTYPVALLQRQRALGDVRQAATAAREAGYQPGGEGWEEAVAAFMKRMKEGGA